MTTPAPQPGGEPTVPAWTDITTPLHADDPERAGHWELLARFGSGGMGTVYLARGVPPDGADPDRPVTVKMPHSGGATSRERGHARFRLEVRTLRQVHEAAGETQPSCTPAVLDADTDSDRPWLATSYLPGLSLRDAVTAHGPWPAPALRQLAHRLAVALRTIHGAGVAHCDIKPSNVLLTETGPHIIDFGIACFRTASDTGDGQRDQAADLTELTETGQWAGSPGYLAPERATDAPATFASDVFGWAAVLVYAATGRPPFGTGTAEELLFRARHTEPDLSGVPEELRDQLREALRPDPEDRPAAAELVARLAGGAAADPDIPFSASLPPALRNALALRAAVDFQHATVRRHSEADSRTETPRPAPGASRRGLLLAMGGAALLVGATGSVSYLAGRLVRGADASVAAGELQPEPVPEPDGAMGPQPPGPRSPWDYRTRMDFMGEIALGDRVLLVPPRVAHDCVALNTVDGSERWVATGVRGRRRVITEDGATALLQGATGGDEDQLALLDLDSGEISHSRPLGMTLSAMNITPVIAVRGTVAYLCGHDSAEPVHYLRVEAEPRQVLAYDLENDEVLWRKPMGPVTGTWIVGAVSGDLLVVLGQNTATAYRRSDGEEVWSRALGEELISEEPAGDPPARRIAADEETVVITGRGMLSVDARTGETNWSVEPDLDPEFAGDGWVPDGALVSAPVIVDGVAFVVLARLMVMALDTRTGDRVWSWDTETLMAPVPAGCTLAGGLLFPPTGGIGDSQIALDPATGEVVWERREVGRSNGDPQIVADDHAFYIRVGDVVRCLPRSDEGLPGDGGGTGGEAPPDEAAENEGAEDEEGEGHPGAA